MAPAPTGGHPQDFTPSPRSEPAISAAHATVPPRDACPRPRQRSSLSLRDGHERSPIRSPSLSRRTQHGVQRLLHRGPLVHYSVRFNVLDAGARMLHSTARAARKVTPVSSLENVPEVCGVNRACVSAKPNSDDAATTAAGPLESLPNKTGRVTSDAQNAISSGDGGVVPPTTQEMTQPRESSNAVNNKSIPHYASNYIHTTKYTLLSFLPLNIFGQFRRLSNIYFLLGTIFSIFSPAPVSLFTQIAPLVLILMVTAIKDAIEDFARYRADQLANRCPCVVIREGQRLDAVNMDLVPGDVIFVTKNSKLPADLLLLSSSSDDGSCFVETSELDGETALKPRVAPCESTDAVNDASVSLLGGQVDCEPPNPNMARFEGRCCYYKGQNFEAPTSSTSLNMTNLVLRGCYLRNTEFIYGVVLYAGHDTKIIRNLKQGSLKFSSLEKKINHLVLAAFSWNMVMLISSLFFSASNWKAQIKHWYLFEGDPLDTLGSENSNYLELFMMYFVIYTYTIPVSLFVTIEVVRLVQRYLIMSDENLNKTDHPPRKMHVKNSNLNEDLACVKYILSDKTGTLTKNQMELKHVFTSTYGVIEPSDFKDTAGKDSKLEELVKCILFCNEAMPPESQELRYESPSPDEVALLEGVKNVNRLISRKKDILKLENDFFVTLLASVEFNSDRKRMNVVIKDQNNKIFHYAKGADDSVIPNTHGDASAVRKQLLSFSNAGMRTLVFARVELSPTEADKFLAAFSKASESLKNRQAQIDAVVSTIEKEMELLGCTAIEDKLQRDVPETIAYLLKCGIKVWMLTGDKQETAINIAISCRLISTDTNVFKFNRLEGNLMESLKKQLQGFVKSIDSQKEGSRPQQNALVLTGELLECILGDESCEADFLYIGSNCKTVVCCRVTPLQKARVVRLVRYKNRVVTLSVGDGANDVSMIQEANIGIGIEGFEGAQAVRASDYAIGEFRFLGRLLAVHGRQSLLRFSGLIGYSFYKNIVFISVQFLYGFDSLWGGSVIYNATFFAYWNVLYTSFPPLAYAILERDASDETISKNPELYRHASRELSFSAGEIALWTFEMIYHILVIFGVQRLFQNEECDGSLREWVSACTLLVVTLTKISFRIHYMTIIGAISIVISYAIYALTIAALEVASIIMPQYSDGILKNTALNLHSYPQYWLSIAVAPILASLPSFTLKLLLHEIRPKDGEVLREEEKKSKIASKLKTNLNS